MKLFLVHCGYYDPEVGMGVFENHVDFFVVASDYDEARTKAKQLPQVQQKRMHIDGLLEIQQVQGYQIQLSKTEGEETLLVPQHFRELAPKK